MPVVPALAEDPVAAYLDLRSSDEAAQVDLAQSRRRLTVKAKAFLRAYMSQGFVDPAKAALAAGYSRGDHGHVLAREFADLIEQERLRLQAAGLLSLGEAQVLLSTIARAPDLHPRDRVRAIELHARLQGALSDKTDAGDIRGLVRDMEELVERMRSATVRRRAPATGAVKST